MQNVTASLENKVKLLSLTPRFIRMARNSIKPTLRKVSKYENKFAKLQKKAAEFNFRNQLKQVKKKEFTMEDEDNVVNNIYINKTLSIGYIIKKMIS